MICKRMNAWLEDEDYINKLNFNDKYYLNSLCVHVLNFLKNVPVPIITSYDPKFKRIFFTVGKEKKGFKINTNVSYFEFISLVKRWAENYYPKYEVEYEDYIQLSDDEIWKRKEKGEDLNDLLNIKVPIKKKELGMIRKIFMMNDQFILYVNNKSILRISGKPQNPKKLSDFLKELRLITDDNLRKNYIYDNSTEIKELHDKSEIVVAYSGRQMINFFKINYKIYKDFPIVKDKENDYIYKWAKFKIRFESALLLNDCLNVVDKLKEKYKVKVN